MVANHDQIRPLAAEQPEQFELRDVRILKFIDENVPVTRAKRFAQRFVRAKMKNGVHDLRAKRNQLAVAQEKIARAVSSRNFLDLGDFFIADAAFILGHRAADALKGFRLLRGIVLVIIRSDQLILAAGEKIHEIAEKLSGLRQAPVVLQLKERQVAAKQNPVVDFIDGLKIRIEFLQQRVAEGVKRAKRDRLGASRVQYSAVARRRDHAVLHFRGGLIGKRQAQNFLAREFRLGIEQIADALCDDASLARDRAGYHNERSLAVMRRSALLRIELNSRRRVTGTFKQVGHIELFQPTTVAHVKRGGVNT